MTSAEVGLVLLYASTLTGSLTVYSVSSAVLESQFVSVERVAEYTRLPSESSSTASPQTDRSWPQHGGIVFGDVHLRYGPHMPPALNGVTLEIDAGSKVALCGRTGCGKSSLLGALVRL